MLERRELQALKTSLTEEETEEMDEAEEGRRVSEGSKWAYRENRYKQTSTGEEERRGGTRHDSRQKTY